MYFVVMKEEDGNIVSYAENISSDTNLVSYIKNCPSIKNMFYVSSKQEAEDISKVWNDPEEEFRKYVYNLTHPTRARW